MLVMVMVVMVLLLLEVFRSSAEDDFRGLGGTVAHESWRLGVGRRGDAAVGHLDHLLHLATVLLQDQY